MTTAVNHPSANCWAFLCSTILLFLLSFSHLSAQVGSASSQSAATSPVPASAPHDNTYIIGNDDVLTVNVWKEPDISRSVPVRSDGNISLPLVGEVRRRGAPRINSKQTSPAN